MKKLNNTVYKCDLLSITSDVEVYCDKSRKENIADAATIKVKEILVQPGFGPGYMKEIITGKKIPVYLIQEISSCEFDDEPLVYRYPPKIPCFILRVDKYKDDEYRKNNWKRVTFKELVEYLENNDPLELVQELDSLFSTADNYYQEALDKQLESDELKIKRLLKYRRNNY